MRFGTKLYRQTAGIPIGTNCAPLVADVHLLCYERDFMKSLSPENQAHIIEAFNSTSRYLDDVLTTDISVLRVVSGSKVKLASCKSALTPPPPRPGGFFISL